MIQNPIITDFTQALARLKEVLQQEKTDIIRDSAIKRFELTFDLSWKSIKQLAKLEGVECNSPRSCFKVAYQLKLITYEDKWLMMISDRNLTVHAYNQKYANEVYSRLAGYVALFEQLLAVF